MALIRSSESISKPSVYRVIGIQLLVTVLVGIASMVWLEPAVAESVVYGGLIAVIPNAYFSWRAWLYTGTRSAAKATGTFIQAEFGKLLLTMLLFAAVFKLAQPEHPKLLVAVFAAIVLTGALAPAKLLKKAA